MLLAASLAPLGSTMIAVALPSIGRDIGAEASDLTQWLVSSYLITSIALQSPGGKLGDLIGHGRALVVGLSLVATGGVLGLLVGDVHALGVARILMASGGAATVPATMAILRNQTAADRRARVFGLFGACMGLAAAIGPLVGGELTERFGWRAVFAANLPVIAVSLLLVLMSRGMYTRAGGRPAVLRLAGQRAARRRPHADHRRAPDVRERRVVARRERRRAAHRVSILGAARRVAGRRFLAAQARARSSAAARSSRCRTWRCTRCSSSCRSSSTGCATSGARTMGQALLALTVAMMLSSMAGGRLTERIGARAQTLAGSLVALAGLWWFADFESVRVPLDVMPGMLLIGAGVGMTSPPAQAASMSTVGREQSGMAGGVVSTMRYIGGVAGTTVLGVLLRDSASPASHQRPLFVYAGALVVAAALSLLLPGRQKEVRRNRGRGSTCI